MNFLLLALTDREAAAVDSLIRRTWAGARCVIVPRSISHSVPSLPHEADNCEICIADIFGLGMRKHSEQAESQLRSLLMGKPVLLVYWGSGGGWLEAVDRGIDFPVELVRSPISTSEFFLRVERLLRAGHTRVRENEQEVVVLTPTALRPSVPTHGSLGFLVQAIPELKEMPLIAYAARFLQTDCVACLRTGSELLLTVDGARGGNWISDYSIAELHKLLGVPGFSKDISYECCDQMGGEVQRQAEKMYASDVAVWRLVELGLRDKELQACSEMSFSLTSWPNFSAFSDVSALQVKLAAHCLSRTVNVSDMMKIVPAHRGSELLRFVVLSVVSGLAKIGPPNRRLELVSGYKKPVTQEAERSRPGIFKAWREKVLGRSRVYKVVFAGPVGAGKTTAIRMLSDIEVVDTDVKGGAETENIKSTTTVAMDYGLLKMSNGDRVNLYGAPGQKRFDFMWEALSENALGLVLLISAKSPDPIRELTDYVQSFGQIIQRGGLVVGLTHADGDVLKVRRRLMKALDEMKLKPCVMEIDARERKDVALLVRSLMCLVNPDQDVRA